MKPAQIARGALLAMVSASLLAVPAPTEAKSKAFFRKKGKQLCIGGGCTKAPKPVTQVVDSVNRSDIGRITGDVAREAGIGVQNIERETRRVGGQVGIQLKRSQDDIGEMGTAVYRFMLHQAASTGKMLNRFEERFREGKFVDAIWHLGTEPFQETEKNAAAAAMESDVLATVGSVVASSVGPGGAAAYAAWLTYNKTCAAGKCDPDLALRIGLIAGAAQAGNIKAAEVKDVVKRAALTGAIAGTAVAASGGKPDAIHDAIFRAGASVVVQEGYRRYVGRDMLHETKPAFGDPMCMTVNPTMTGPTQCPNGQAPKFMKADNGKYLLQDEKNNWHEVAEGDLGRVPPTWRMVGDASSTPDGTPVVGVQTGRLPPSGANLFAANKFEGSTLMTTVAKIPGMNGMALFHDRWAVNWAMSSDPAVMGSIPVAMVLVYTGDTLVYDAASSRAIVDAAIKDAAAGRDTGTAPETLKAQAAGGQQHVLIPQSIMCNKDDQFKAFNVAWGTAPGDLQCAVSVTNGDKISEAAPWYAAKEKDFCSRKIQDMAAPLLKEGWACKAR